MSTPSGQRRNHNPPAPAPIVVIVPLENGLTRFEKRVAEIEKSLKRAQVQQLAQAIRCEAAAAPVEAAPAPQAPTPPALVVK